jgi:ABC-type branched-subunit amino acid transport system substrate-binding protein
MRRAATGCFRSRLLIGITAGAIAASAADAIGGKSDPGTPDGEIKIGQTAPYSGPVSGYGTVGKAMLAYFAKVNDEGGMNGRKVRLISLDDGFSPSKTVEQTRKLVEDENVLLVFGTVGTPTNSAIYKYLNRQRVPHLFILTGSPKLADPTHYPWTMPLHHSFDLEGSVYARYLLRTRPDARVGVLYQNDDYGKSLLTAFKRTLGEKARAIVVAEAAYEITDPTVDQQIISLQASGANTLVDFSTTKATAQAIRKVHDIGWRPLHIVTLPASSIETTLRAAGLEKSIGLISATFMKDIQDPSLANDPGVRDYRAWFEKYYPEGNVNDERNVQAYLTAQALVYVLKQCGNDLSRDNVMRQAAHLDGVRLPLLFPGITLATSPTEYFPIRRLQLVRFDGSRWKPFGELMDR